MGTGICGFSLPASIFPLCFYHSFQDARMDTGFVTTTRVSHATPAALYAHSADRFWECDKKLPEGAPEDVKDISWQLIHNDPGNKIKGNYSISLKTFIIFLIFKPVMLGGGRSSFIPEEDQTNHTNINARYTSISRKSSWHLILFQGGTMRKMIGNAAGRIRKISSIFS